MGIFTGPVDTADPVELREGAKENTVQPDTYRMGFGLKEP